MSILIPLIQKIFELDPDHQYFVKDLKDQKFGISLLEWNLQFTLVPEEDALKVIQGVDTADVTISGKLADFIMLKDMNAKQAAFAKSNLEVKGDIRVLSLYQDFFDKLDLDWIQMLSNIIGEKPAALLAKPLEILFKETKRQAGITLKNLPEILQEEKQLLPPKQEVEDFFADIKKLQMDVDRLAKKIS